jgi:hypothetical protein
MSRFGGTRCHACGNARFSFPILNRFRHPPLGSGALHASPALQMDSARRTVPESGNRFAGSFPPILEHLIRQRGLPPGWIWRVFAAAAQGSGGPVPDSGHAGRRWSGSSGRSIRRRNLHLRRLRRRWRGLDHADAADPDGIRLEPRHFIPRRGPEGYGLSTAALERCMSGGPEAGSADHRGLRDGFDR